MRRHSIGIEINHTGTMITMCEGEQILNYKVSVKWDIAQFQVVIKVGQYKITWYYSGRRVLNYNGLLN